MKTINSLLCLCWAGAVLGLAFHVRPAQAASGNPPDLMTYQGYLVDENGNPLGQSAPKNYDVVFSIWKDQLSTATANRLWTEQQTITIDKGYFSVLLGEGAVYSTQARPALSTLFTGTDASDRYIEMMVKGIGTGGNDVTIAPRLRLLTSPYAFLARTAVNAQTLVNNSYAQVVNISGSNVGINKTSPTSALDVNGAVAATALTVSGAASVNSLTVAGNATVSGAVTVPTLNASGTAGIGTLRVTNNATVGGTLTVTGNVTTTGSFSGHGTIPIGGIIMWSGAINQIPAGWGLCDGNYHNNRLTPDLTDRFVLGAGRNYTPGAVGGAANRTLTIAQMPSHSHGVNHATYSWNNGTWADRSVQQVVGATAPNPYATATTGGNQAFSIMPPYYALAYIMRVQ